MERHPFHSPYRCQECDTRFLVVSRKARVRAAAAGVCALLLMLYAIGRSPIPSDHGARAGRELPLAGAPLSAMPLTDDSILTQNELPGLGQMSSGTAAAPGVSNQ